MTSCSYKWQNALMARPLGEVVLAHVEEGEVGENVEDPEHL